MATITSANSIFMLGVANLFNVPQQMQGYAADDAFMVEDVDIAETVMGVDGKLSAGYTPFIVPLEFTLQADSPSNDIMDALITAEEIAKEKYQLNGSILVPGISKIFTFTKGFLRRATVVPAGKKTMQPRKFTIDFESVVGAPT